MIRITENDTKKYRKLSFTRDFIYNMNQAVAFCLIKNEDGSDEVSYYGEAFLDPSNGAFKPEYIYILVNKSIPGICKIGFTTMDVERRAKEINSATGVITPWYPVFSLMCGSGAVLEREIHQHLEQLGVRVNRKREGFSIDSTQARQIIEDIAKKYQNI